MLSITRVAGAEKRMLECRPMHARRRALALFAVGLGLAAWGCAHAPQPARPPAGYERLVDPLSSVDPSGLRGRRIVLDPGHGGYFRGALGVHGLTEAEVNLGVALQLRDLLVAHGAYVRMTHESDIATFAQRVITFRDGEVVSDVTQVPAVAAPERARQATEVA